MPSSRSSGARASAARPELPARAIDSARQFLASAAGTFGSSGSTPAAHGVRAGPASACGQPSGRRRAAHVVLVAERTRKASGRLPRSFSAARHGLAFQRAAHAAGEAKKDEAKPGEAKEAAKDEKEEEQKNPRQAAALAITETPPAKLAPSAWENVIFSATAPMIAVLFTNPFDVAKTRMQLQGELMRAGEGRKFANVFDCLIKTAKYEGFAGLQKGLGSMLVREALINSLRLGTFEPILHRIHDRDLGPAPIFKKLIAGGIAGALGSFAANPVELVKTRLQSRASSNIAVGNQFEYSGLLDAAGSIVRENGVTGLWKGASAGVLRSVVGNATMLTTYQQAREWCVHGARLRDSPAASVASSLAAGLVSSLALNPVDVVRTRLYNQRYSQDGRGATYSGIPDAVWKIATTEGPTAFLKGFSSNYLFRGPQILISFNIIEAFKHTAKQRLREKLQTRNTYALFASLDRDGDGRIAEDDLLELVKRAYARGTPLALRVPGEASDDLYGAALRAKVAEILKLAGAEASRDLDQRGFDRARRSLFGLARRAAEGEAFIALDADKDGLLSEADLEAALRPLAQGAGAGAEEAARGAAARLVAHADRDRDGKVGFEDFTAVFGDYELPNAAAGPRTLLGAWLRDAGVPLQ